MKVKMDPFDCAGQICKALTKGILITAKHNGKVNPMTIGWGHIGREWNKPIFVAYVRESRFTREMIEQTGEFTVNAPIAEGDRKIISFCGTKSGRDVDKVSALGLHLEESNVIGAPGICEFPLTLECKVLFQTTQTVSQLPGAVQDRFYPDGEDAHIAFWAEIVDAYRIQPEEGK